MSESNKGTTGAKRILGEKTRAYILLEEQSESDREIIADEYANAQAEANYSGEPLGMAIEDLE